MQASMSFSSLQASYTTTHWSALGEEIKNNQANSVPQISEEEGNSQKTSNILSSTEILNNKIGDFQKQIINQALNKISEIQDEMIKVWEEVFGMSSENSSSTNTSISGSIESLLNGNFSRPSYNVGSGISITQGFYQSLELSIQGTIVGKDGVSRKLDLSINVSQSFVQNLQINSQNTNTNNTNSNKVIDPLVIDYAGNGTELSDTKMSFDLDSDGKEDQISTLKEGSGFLALDKNNDGKINNGNELFGTQSGDGFKDLSAYDLNQDGKIDKEDPIYDKLRIWTPNEKGEGELVGLGEKGIGVIYLDAKESQDLMKGEEGDLLGIKQKTSNFIREDGSAGEIHHIDLVAGDNSTQNTSNPTLQEGLQLAANRAYMQNLSISFSFSQSSGNILASNNASSGFSLSAFSFSASQYSFSLSSLENANNGVSKELSTMWKVLQETFVGFEKEEESPMTLKTLLENFSESFEDLNRFVFGEMGFDKEENPFKNTLSNIDIQRLLAA